MQQAALDEAALGTLAADVPSAVWTAAEIRPMRHALVRVMQAQLQARVGAGAAYPRVAYAIGHDSAELSQAITLALSATDEAHGSLMASVLDEDADFGALLATA